MEMEREMEMGKGVVTDTGVQRKEAVCVLI